jgi:hypothetical protein
MTGDNDLKAVVFVTLFRSVRPTGIKARPRRKVSRLVFTTNVLVRLDDGGLRSKAAPLVGLGYTSKRSRRLVSKPAPVACSVRRLLAHSAFNAYYLSIPRKTKSLGDSRD